MSYTPKYKTDESVEIVRNIGKAFITTTFDWYPIIIGSWNLLRNYSMDCEISCEYNKCGIKASGKN